jgi:hypothetical protein
MKYNIYIFNDNIFSENQTLLNLSIVAFNLSKSLDISSWSES